MRARAAAAEVGVKRGAWYPSARTRREHHAAEAGRPGRHGHDPEHVLRAVADDELASARRGRPAGRHRRSQGRSLLLRLSCTTLRSRDSSSTSPALTTSTSTPRLSWPRRKRTSRRAKESLEAAEERHRAGVATIADVLLARTAASQAEFDLATAEGLVQTSAARLRPQLGVPANIPVEAGDLPRDRTSRPRRRRPSTRLIEQAAAERPDLAARRLEVEKAAAHVRSVRSAGLPRSIAAGHRSAATTTRTRTGNNGGQCLLRRHPLPLPVFTGFSNVYAVAQGEGGGPRPSRRTSRTTRTGVLQVWRSYYGVRTASQRVRTTRDLLAERASSPRRSPAAATGPESAESSICWRHRPPTRNARAQEVQARAEWYLAMAQLAHDVGAPRAPEESRQKP